MILVFFHSRKMPQIARNQVIGAGRIGTFQEPIVIGIARHFKTPRRYDQVTSVSDELEQLPAQTLADFEFRAGENFGVFLENVPETLLFRRYPVKRLTTLRQSQMLPHCCHANLTCDQFFHDVGSAWMTGKPSLIGFLKCTQVPKEPVCKALTKDCGDAGTRIRSLCRVRRTPRLSFIGNPRIAPFVFR